MAFIEDAFCGDRKNWWVPNEAGVQGLLRSAGFRVTAQPGEETFLCEPDPRGGAMSWDAAELMAATGRWR